MALDCPTNFSWLNAGNDLGGANDHTIAVSIWLKMNAFGSGLDTFISKGYDGSNTAWYLYLMSTTAIFFGTFRSPTEFGAGAAHGFSTGVWNHVYGDYNGTAWRIYFNGSQANSSTTATGPSSTTEIFAIAAVYILGAAQRGVAGYLAEAAVWSNALGDGAIAALARGYSPLYFQDGLRFYCPLHIRKNPEKDLVNGLSLTHNNTPINHPHPRVIYPSGHPSGRFGAAAAPAGRVFKLAGYGGGLVGPTRGLAAKPRARIIIPPKPEVPSHVVG
jgi:hypothetical protein